MRHITISVLSVFVVLPALASARLPVVNVASGGVSARAAFGEDATIAKTKTPIVTPSVASPTRTRNVVARTVKAPLVQKSVDVGENIIASNDVLAPRRPSNDLWAKNDVALRMPTANEFSVFRSDNLLPEESLDKPTRVATVTPAHVASDDVSPMHELDAQIAQLTQLQRQSDNAARTVSPRVIRSPISNTVAPVVTASEPLAPVSEPVRVARADVPKTDQEINLRRLVVPMDSDDVIVRSVEKNKSPRIAAVRDDMSKMSPSELRRAFRKTFLSENKHFSTYSIDDRFDTVSDMSQSIEGFTARSNLSEDTGIKKLEIKITFRNDDSALTRENYTLLAETAALVANRPTSAIQVAIPQSMTTSKDGRKLAARRLAIVEQALTDNGVSVQRIVPVLAQRNEPSFVLRVISNEKYETLTQQSQNIFGDTVSKKSYKSMSW